MTARLGWIVAVAALPVLWSVPLWTDASTLAELNRIAALGLLAASVALLTGYCGLPTLGQVAPFAVGAYTTFQLAQADFVTGPMQLFAAALGGAAVSLATGPFVLRTRGIVFLMVTLAIGMLTGSVAEQWRSLTGGTEGTGYIPASLPWWGQQPLVDEGDIYHYVVIVVVLVLAVTSMSLRGTPGKLLRGVRDNESRMHASGHRVTRYLLLAYLAAGVMAAIAGSLYATSQRFVFPSDVGFDVAAVMLLAVVIGGTRSIVAAVAGVAIVMVTRYSIAPEAHSELVLGLLFITAVYVLPHGITGWATALWDRSRRWRTQ